MLRQVREGPVERGAEKAGLQGLGWEVPVERFYQHGCCGVCVVGFRGHGSKRAQRKEAVVLGESK